MKRFMAVRQTSTDRLPEFLIRSPFTGSGLSAFGEVLFVLTIAT